MSDKITTTKLKKKKKIRRDGSAVSESVKSMTREEILEASERKKADEVLLTAADNSSEAKSEIAATNILPENITRLSLEPTADIPASQGFLTPPENEPTDGELLPATKSKTEPWMKDLRNHLQTLHDYGSVTVTQFAELNSLQGDMESAKRFLDRYIDQELVKCRWYQSKGRYELTTAGTARLVEIKQQIKSAKAKK